ILCFSRCTARQFVKQRPRLWPVPAAKPQARYLGAFDKIVEPEAVLVKDEAWPQPVENIAELVAVHLDVDGADGGARRHHAQIADEMFDRVIGEQRDPIVGLEAALLQKRRELCRAVAQAQRS